MKIGTVEVYSLNGMVKFCPLFSVYFILFWEKKVGTVEAYVLKGINETLPPVFFTFLPILKKKIGRMGSYLLKGINYFGPNFLYFSNGFGKNRYSGSVLTKRYGEILPPIFCIFYPILEKSRYSGSVFAEGYKLNFYPYYIHFSSGFGKKWAQQVSRYGHTITFLRHITSRCCIV